MLVCSGVRRFVCSWVRGFVCLVNKLLLNIDGKKAWIFHGDVFDVTMQYSKWLAKLGAVGYDSLIHLNTLINWFLQKFGKEKMSLSKKIKNSVKNAVKFINDFEETAANIAIEKGYDYVICGHIHQPEMRTIKNEFGEVMYLNSGDWIENLTSLEYHNGKWRIFDFKKEKPLVIEDALEEEINLNVLMDVRELYKSLVK